VGPRTGLDDVEMRKMKGEQEQSYGFTPMPFLFNCWLKRDISNTMSRCLYDPSLSLYQTPSRSLVIANKAKAKKKIAHPISCLSHSTETSPFRNLDNFRSFMTMHHIRPLN
jgi:hypothetical protein